MWNVCAPAHSGDRENGASEHAEDCWKYVHTFAELDLERKEQGNGLDELNAHRFLERLGETLTVKELREKLRETGAIASNERPKLVYLTHYLLFKYGVDWHVLVNTCGDNSELIAEAQRKLDEVHAAFQLAKEQADIARKREEEARTAEAPFKAAQEELEAAVAELKAQEEAYENKKQELQTKGEGSGVGAMRARNELAQLLAEGICLDQLALPLNTSSDPLPLRRAKITQEAALKKAEKLRAPFEAATRIAVAARWVFDSRNVALLQSLTCE